MPPAKVQRVAPGKNSGATSRRPRRSSVESRVSQWSGDSFKNFYGNWRARFPKTCAKEKSRFSVRLLQLRFDQAIDAQVAKAADLIEESLRAGNKLLVCGNGGSAADAYHFATEFVVRFTKDRPAYGDLSCL
jgi:glutathione S-transferase